jgi:hypothetical protein
MPPNAELQQLNGDLGKVNDAAQRIRDAVTAVLTCLDHPFWAGRNADDWRNGITKWGTDTLRMLDALPDEQRELRTRAAQQNGPGMQL